MPASSSATAGEPWIRKHDPAGHPRVAIASAIVRPSSLSAIIAICRDHEAGVALHAAGSHWALSDAAVSDHTFIETNDPDRPDRGLAGVLREVVPGCLNPDYVSSMAMGRNAVPLSYPFHFLAGTKIYQAYSAMDLGDTLYPDSLARLLNDRYGNGDYLGSWAFPTLGGAGGQTIAGAIMTGTHGGDFELPPMSDGIVAAHVVLDGGSHLWVERTSTALGPPLTDPDQLRQVYGADRYGGASTFNVVRDDDTLNALITSVGRFGVVYSLVVEAVPQFCLHENRRLQKWQDIAAAIADRNSDLYHDPGSQANDQRFLQIAVCLTRSNGYSDNLAGVTKRWITPNSVDPRTGDLAGRAERRGQPLPTGSGVDFDRAGCSFPYSPDPQHPDTSGSPSLLLRASQDPNVIIGAIRSLGREIEEHLVGETSRESPALRGAEFGQLITDDDLYTARDTLLKTTNRFVTDENQVTLGEALDVLRGVLLANDALRKYAGVHLWRALAKKIFESQQRPQDYAAISYAVMDGHNYLDRSINVNVESAEVFFDATNPALVQFVDGLINFEAEQEESGKVFVGYASLRFTGRTQALLGPQLWPLTCAVEVAGLADVDGTAALVGQAERLARAAGAACMLHWGQRNDATSAEIEARLDGTNPNGRLSRWRAVLTNMTSQNTANAFSNAFTRRLGLERRSLNSR